ncbi:MAG: phosphoribosyltransferase family protein [Ilumatobacteraceae bacterium]
MPAQGEPGSGPRQVMSADDVRRAITRIGHEIVERNHGIDGVVLVGLQRGGVWIAEQLQATLRRIDGAGDVPLGTLDVSFYRDDVGIRPIVPGSVTDIPGSLDGTHVVLVDDVLFTGRTVRAALGAITDHGRPRIVNSPSSSTAATARCRSGRTTWARTCRRRRQEDVAATADGVWLA